MTLTGALSEICPGGVRTAVPLAEFSRWRVGGLADVLVEPASVDELRALRRYLAVQGIAHLVIGSTSNLLFSDEGLRAVCIKLSSRFGATAVRGNRVEAEAGAWVPGLARRVMQAGLTGAEHVCGVPGTIGGLICMNGGSQRKSIGSAVVRVESVTPGGDVITRERSQCGFGYRRSIFQDNDEIVSRIVLNFETFDRSLIRRRMLEILESRRKKFPQKQPNCGSVFKSNPAMYEEIGPPGAVIERLGFKGRKVGGAMVSALHANFIVNQDRASARDILELIREISESVASHTGYRLEAEARFVRPDGKIVAADAVEKGDLIAD